jgi:hypothetical protein
MASVPSPLHSRYTYLYQQQSVEVKPFADENLAKTAGSLSLDLLHKSLRKILSLGGKARNCREQQSD